MTNTGDSSRFQDRSDQILMAALDLVREVGLTNLTMKKVAERLDLTEPAIYRYYPSKNDLLLAIIQHFDRTILAPSRQIAGRQDIPPAERLATIWRNNLEMHCRMGGAPSVSLAAFSYASDEAPQDLIRQLARRHHEVLERLIEEIAPADLGVRGRELALVMVGLNTAASLWANLLEDEEIRDRVREELIPFLIRCFAQGGAQKNSAAG